MKISKLKMIIPLILMIVSLVCQPVVWAGEHPWDGDSSPAGGQGSGSNGGSGSGGTGDGTTPRPMTRLVVPESGSGLGTMFSINGFTFRFMTSVYANWVAKSTTVLPATDEKSAVKSTAVSGVKK